MSALSTRLLHLTRQIVLPALLSCLVLAATCGQAVADMSACLSSTGEAAVSACERELGKDPRSMKARLALYDALIGLRRYQDAVDLLEKGLTLHPGNSELTSKLSLAKSYVDEQTFIKRRRVEAEMDALTKRNVIRCTMLKGDSALQACDEVLKLKPGEAMIYTAKGKALVGMERYVEAILAYRKALKLDPADAEAASGLRTAQTGRTALVRTCTTGRGSTALNACNAAMLEGEPDQAKILKSKAELLLAGNRKDEALRALRQAQKLDPGDSAVKKKIAQLTAPPPKKVVKKPPVKVVAKPPEPKPVAKPVEKKLEPKPVAKPVEKKPEPVKVVAAKEQAPPPKPVVEVKRFSNMPRVAGITH